MSEGIPRSRGVLPAEHLRKAIAEGWLQSDDADATNANVQPASIDLRLGATAYRLRSSFLPGAESVHDRLGEFSMGALDLADGAILERGRPYLIPLQETLALPPDVRGRTNPKSSTGRVDVFTRVITERGGRFDEIPAGYTGRLYLEVFSRSFTIKVGAGLTLNQLRLVAGGGDLALDDGALAGLHEHDPILFGPTGGPLGGDLVVAGGLFVGVDLSAKGAGGVGYKARRNSKLLDLSKRDHDPDDFWEPVYAERGDRLVLEPEEFYLLISSERVRIPPTYAAEMEAYDPTAGELRTHYAGFFDPGFGHGKPGASGTRAVLEVRARDVPFILEHGQSVCKLVYEPMLETPEVLYGSGLGSHYQDQELTLSKHFRAGRRRAQVGVTTENRVPRHRRGFGG